MLTEPVHDVDLDNQPTIKRSGDRSGPHVPAGPLGLQGPLNGAPVEFHHIRIKVLDHANPDSHE